ncbi:MAG: glycosyltransferase family 2 protein [Acidobacteria bacterium]|nr:glycosyltransferase family 2 protein [Acidobacteriota bacterium]
MYKGWKITVVIPCLNEEQGIQKVLAKIPEFVDETVVVDNNSTDRTGEVASRMGAKVIRERILGYGRAYKTGLLHAQGDIIVTLDGDHSYPVDAISYLVENLLRSKARFLSASRFPIRYRGVMSFKHRIGNHVLSAVMSLLFMRRVRDSQSGMWIFFKDALQHMKLESNAMPFSEEIKIEAILNKNIGFEEIPIIYSNRAGEMKLQPWKDGFKNLSYLFKKRFLR